MGNDRHGLIELLSRAAKEVEYLCSRAGVKVPRRLISQQDRWLSHKSPSYGDTLLLTSRVLVSLRDQPYQVLTTTFQFCKKTEAI